MNTVVKTKLSLMMFLEFFIWGAWFVTLSTYLFKLGFSGGQVGSAYSTTALAAIISPFFIGMIADKFFPAQIVLGILHLLGGVILYWVSGVTDPGTFFWALLAYALCYMPTLALVNAIAFNQVTDTEKEFPLIRAIGTTGWIVAGLIVGFTHREDTNIPLVIASGVSIVMGVYSFMLPNTPPKSAGKKVSIGDILGVESLRLMKDGYFTIFVVASLLISMTTPFYFSFVNPYFNESGMQYPAAMMTGGQVIEVVFITLLPFVFARLGVKMILAMGMLAWSLRYFLLAFGDADSLIFLWYISILLHGACFGFFFVAGQIYVEKVAPKSIQAGAQGFISLITFGVGTAIGARFAGFVVDRLSGNWQQIWLTPAVISLVVGILFIGLFQVKPAKISVDSQ